MRDQKRVFTNLLTTLSQPFMPIDAKGRIKRARKAARVAAKNRKAKVKQRDQYIYWAFCYLSDRPLQKMQCAAAMKFLVETSGNANIRSDQTVYRKLADCTKLTRQRIYQIVKKAQNST